MGFYRLHLSHSQHKQSKLFGSRMAVCRWHSGESKMHGKLFSLVIIAWVEGRKRQNRREYEGITDTKSDNCFNTCEKTLNGSRPSSDRRQQARLNVLMITLNCLFSLVLFFSLCSVFWNFNFTHFRLACLVCVLRVISLSRLAIERRKTETTSRRKSKK